MQFPFNLRLGVFCVLLASAALCHADTKITVRMVYKDSSKEGSPNAVRTVYYRSGAMRRKEVANSPLLPSIANCATGTGFFIDMSSGQYRSYKVAKFRTAEDIREYLKTSPDNPYHIVFVQVESKTVDTGERKTFFGFEAKHLITTTKRAAASGGTGGEEIIDGWYIDHDRADNNCAPESVRAEPFFVVPTLLLDPGTEYPEYHHTGPLPVGLAVKEIRTEHLAARNGEAARTLTMEETVEELSDSPLTPAMFDLPAGLKENPQLFRNGGRVPAPQKP